MNAKKLVKVGLLTVGLTLAMSAAAFAATDTQGHWAQNVITKWENQGLIEGYPDGTFRPDQQITRAEKAALINRIAGYPAAGTAAGFTDVPGDAWFAGDVATAAAQGYMSGYDATTFGPNDVVTREQAAIMYAKIKALTANETRAYEFADGNAVSSWALGSVGAVADAGYMIGDTANMFHPMTAMTRAEAVSALDRLFEIPDAPQGGEPTQPTEPTEPTTPASSEINITLTGENGSVAVNHVKTVNYTTAGDVKVTAASSDETIATVEVQDGKIAITGVKKGSATITVTATAEDGTTATDTYDITVNSGISTGGGGGSSSTSNYSGIIPEGNITPAGTLTSSDLSSGKVTTALSGKTLTLNNTTGKEVEKIEAVLPAGTKVTVSGLASGPITFTTTKDLTRTTNLDTVESLTVSELMGAVDASSDAYTKLKKASDTLGSDYVLISGSITSADTETSVTFAEAEGLTVDNAQDVVKALKVTVTTN